MTGTLFISKDSLFTDAFDDCFERERTKRKEAEASSNEAIDNAQKVYTRKSQKTYDNLFSFKAGISLLDNESALASPQRDPSATRPKKINPRQKFMKRLLIERQYEI